MPRGNNVSRSPKCLNLLPTLARMAAWLSIRLTIRLTIWLLIATSFAMLFPANVSWAAHHSQGGPISTRNGEDVRQIYRLDLDEVAQAVFLPDGITLAAATPDGVILATPSNGEILGTLDTGPAAGLAVSPDGESVVTFSGPTAKLWRIADGALLEVFAGHVETVTAVAFSPEGQRLATAAADGSVRVWRARDAAQLLRLNHVGQVISLAYRSDGRVLVTGSNLGVTAWDAISGSRIRIIDIRPRTTSAVAFSPDGNIVAAGYSNGYIRLWRGTTFAYVRDIPAHTGGVTGLLFDPTGNLLVSTGTDGRIRLWDLDDGSRLGELTGHVGDLFGIAQNSAGSAWVTAGLDGSVRVWATNARALPSPTPTATVTPTRRATSTRPPSRSTATPTPSPTPRPTATPTPQPIALPDTPLALEQADEFTQLGELPLTGAVNAAFSPDGQWIAVARDNGSVALFDAESQILTLTLRARSQRLAFSPDSGTLATATGTEVSLWAIPAGDQIQELSLHSRDVTDVAFSPDGRYLSTTSVDRSLRVWDAQTGELIRRFGHFGQATSTAFSPNSELVAVSTTVGTVVWRVADGGREHILYVGSIYADALAFHPDGSTLVGAMQDRRIWLWRLRDGGEAVALIGHTAPVTDLAFTPKGDMLVSASEDGSVRLWHGRTGASGGRLPGVASAQAVDLSPDGAVLLVVEDGVVSLWGIE